MITSQSNGDDSPFSKTDSSSSDTPISRSLWIVLASLPVDSVILFAALPVGAPRSTLIPLFSYMWMIAFIIVVLPVPGPPVIISIPLLNAPIIASFCDSANFIFCSFSNTPISKFISELIVWVSCNPRVIIFWVTPSSQ